MAVIAGTKSYLTTVYVTAASGGDATTIAAMFNGLTIAGVDIVGTATASVSATTLVTITWPANNVRAGDSLVLDAVMNIIAANLTLTTPIVNIYVRTEGKIV